VETLFGLWTCPRAGISGKSLYGADRDFLTRSKPVPPVITRRLAASPMERMVRDKVSPLKACIGVLEAHPSSSNRRHKASTGLPVNTSMPQLEAIVSDEISAMMGMVRLTVHEDAAVDALVIYALRGSHHRTIAGDNDAALCFDRCACCRFAARRR